MRSLFYKNFNLGLCKGNPLKSKLNQAIRTFGFRNKARIFSVNISIGLGIFCSFYFSNSQIKCAETNQSKSNLSSEENQVEIFQLNKYQLLQLLTNVNEEMIFVIYNKYFRNEHEKEFAEKFEKLYLQVKDLKINKIYLIEKNDIKHLETFEKWLHNDKSEAAEETNASKQSENKIEYFFLTPHFKSNPFKIQEEEVSQQISEIRKYQIRFNPKISQEVFANYKSQFNLTTVIKQCPDYVLPMKENQCVEEYRSQIATLIEQKMLKNKSQEFAFYAFLSNSKKDNSPILSFQNALKMQKSQEKQLPNGEGPQSEDQKKSQNIYVLRNDMLGREIDNLKSFKRINYSSLKSLSSYDKFLLFIKPRIFIVSKANSSIDLYWYVTCMHKNRQPTISVNNTDSFNLGRKHPVTNGLSYPQNTDLEFLKLLYKNHPNLNFLIVNTEIVSELIRHLPVKRRYSIFSLTSDLIYPKIFLPHLEDSLSVEQNYQQKFRPLIEKYISDPKNYDYVVLDKEKKINTKDLEDLIKKNNQRFVLRVCSLNCQKDISEDNLKIAFKELKQLKSTQNQSDSSNWQNEVYRRTYWIDSHFNNVGLEDGDYIFSQGNFSRI